LFPDFIALVWHVQHRQKPIQYQSTVKSISLLILSVRCTGGNGYLRLVAQVEEQGALIAADAAVREALLIGRIGGTPQPPR
jgi:hypothetical protein